MTKWVYKFGNGKAEGHAADKNLLGGKGANLAEMSSIGIPVPPAAWIAFVAPSMTAGLVPSPVKAAIPALAQADTRMLLYSRSSYLSP